MRDRIVGALETGCRLGEMLKIQNRHVLWDTHQISIPAAHAKDAESRRIPFEPNGRSGADSQAAPIPRPEGVRVRRPRPASIRARSVRRGSRSFYWRTASSRRGRRARGRVNREQLAEIDLHWHDLRHEAACRWLARGLDLRAIQLLLGHADLKTTQRYLNVTDEELRNDDAGEALEADVGRSRAAAFYRMRSHSCALTV